MSAYDHHSPRRNVLEAIKDACEKLRNGSYYVRRGPISWPDFNFSKNPRGVSIQVDDCTWLAPQFNQASIALEFGEKIPLDQDNEPGLEDAALEQMFDDAQIVIMELLKKRNRDGDPVCNLVQPSQANILEFYDSEMKVQGMIATFFVKY